MVKRFCNRFDKRREWNNKGSSLTGLATRRTTEEVPTRSNEMRRDIESSPVPDNVVDDASGGATLEELTKMVHNL